MWRRHMPLDTTTSMDPLDELPDNFDQAYHWFSQLYSEHKGLTDSQRQERQYSSGDPLLNDQEQQAFTKFLDNVLENPSTAAESSEIKWLDQHYAEELPTPVHEEKLFQNDFYRGFRENSQRYVEPGFAVGQHPGQQHSRGFYDSPIPLPQPVHMPLPLLGQSTRGEGFSNFIPKAINPSPPIPPQYTSSQAPPPQANASSHQSPEGGSRHASVAVNSTGSATPAKALATSSYAGAGPPSNYTAIPAAKRPEWQSDQNGEGAQSAKKRRDYLSEDQVRKNHIISEKRRRDLIANNFKAMCALVPGIDDVPGPSQPKSLVLQTVYDYIVNLSAENKALRAALTQYNIDTSGIIAHKLAEPLPPLPHELSPGGSSNETS